MRSFPRLFLLGSALLLLVSCEVRFDWPWLKDEGNSHSGKTVTEDRTIGPFTAVQLEGIGKLVFDGAVPVGTLRITADEGVIKAIEAAVNEGLLRIDADTHQFGLRDIELRVAPPTDLASVTLEGAGSVESAAVFPTSAELKVVLQGVGKIDLEVEAPSVRAEQQGVGELVVGGKAGRVSVVADGVGKVDTSKLITADAEVDSSGAGEVRVYASATLKVRADGLGAVRYLGKPAHTDIQSEGVTSVKAD